ncbi:MAG: DUF1934 domain-containing protein [Lachnospiraceae bacterium]
MTKDVLITVSGTQFEMGEEPIELVVPGTYYMKNGKHYVFYEEQDEEQVTKNSVKFYDGYFEMTKKGANTSCLMFERDKKTSTMYHTIAGPMQIDSTTTVLDIHETENEILVNVRYALDINYKFVSECHVVFKVQAR